MSISGSLSAALSGLTAVSRAAETVSSNISNAMTDGYGRREINLSSRVLEGSGNGVRFDGITRNSDPALIGDRRLSEAEFGQADATFDFLSSIGAAIGTPDNPGGLTGRMTSLEAAIIQASSRPDSDTRLQGILNTATGVANHLNSVSDRVQAERLKADNTIAASVDQMNTALQQIQSLNARIVRFNGGSQDPSSLIDQRQALIDQISELVPLREVPRDNGTIALFTLGGAILLDGRAAEIGFEPVGVIVPDMTIASGALSGLTINGRPVSTSAETGAIAGGKLAGLFDVRDVQATGFQTRLDAVARDLVERFEDPGMDPTLGVGDPGLFTDAGAAIVAIDEIGLAGRISINALADPAQGGALWRIRDGLGAPAVGDPGDASLLNAMSDALTGSRLPVSGGFTAQRSATGLASDLLSGVSVQLNTQETERTYLRVQTDTLIEMELRDGVDTDVELQKLLLIEQSFAANARVISTIDDLIQTLLRI